MKFNYNGLLKKLIDHNMKRKDLVDKLGLSPTTIAKVARGDAISLTTLAKICQELGCDIGDVVRVKWEDEEEFEEEFAE